MCETHHKDISKDNEIYEMNLPAILNEKCDLADIKRFKDEQIMCLWHEITQDLDLDFFDENFDFLNLKSKGYFTLMNFILEVKNRNLFPRKEIEKLHNFFLFSHKVKVEKTTKNSSKLRISYDDR